SGSSPAIAAIGSADWRIAFAAPDHHLWTSDSIATVDTGVVMAVNTSPAIVEQPDVPSPGHRVLPWWPGDRGPRATDKPVDSLMVTSRRRARMKSWWPSRPELAASFRF